MGELRAVFDAMKKEREERRKSLEPSRVQYATDLLIEAWYAVAWDEREKAIYIYKSNDRKNHIAKLYPYKGWWTGKGIGSGRGVHELIKKLGENNVRNTNRRSESRSEKLSKQSKLLRRNRTKRRLSYICKPRNL